MYYRDITDHKLVVRNLFLYFGSYSCISDLILVLRIYTCLPNLILVLQNMYLYFG